VSSRALNKKNPKPTREQSEERSFFGGISQIAGGTILGVTMLASSVIAGSLVGLAISFRNLPDVRVLRSYAPTETTYIYDVKGVQLASLHDEANREVVPLDRISPNLKRSLLAIEDDRFYYHQGVNRGRAGINSQLQERWCERGWFDDHHAVDQKLIPVPKTPI
jgi:penicillin-binding protein 1A